MVGITGRRHVKSGVIVSQPSDVAGCTIGLADIPSCGRKNIFGRDKYLPRMVRLLLHKGGREHAC